jgi:hypothetical protein
MPGEEVGVPYEEKPPSRTLRTVYLILAWIPVGFVFVVLWFWMSWWFLLALIPALWATWDYWRRGDGFSSLDAVSRIGAFLPGAWRSDDH